MVGRGLPSNGTIFASGWPGLGSPPVSLVASVGEQQTVSAGISRIRVTSMLFEKVQRAGEDDLHLPIEVVKGRETMELVAVRRERARADRRRSILCVAIQGRRVVWREG